MGGDNIDAVELKEFIKRNEKQEYILEQIGCEQIKENTKGWSCARPNGTNKNAIFLYRDTLKASIFTPDLNTDGDSGKGGDIYTLVMKVKQVSFGECIKYLHKILGIEYEYKKKSKNQLRQNPLYIFQKIKRNRQVVNRDIEVYDENIIKEYSDLIHIDWVRDGIMPFAGKRFNIGYSFKHKRITIPERKWDGEDNDYLGVIGRTTVPMHKELDIPKYLAIKPYSKGLNLYGLNENYNSIQEKGYVVVAEAQKSVLKRYSRKDETLVSIGCCELTNEQVKILIGLNVEIVICYDEGIDINHIRAECEKIYGIRNVSYFWDKWGLLKQGSKDSPCDLPDKKYKFMLKYRKTYDEKEHKEYTEWREKHMKK